MSDDNQSEKKSFYFRFGNSEGEFTQKLQCKCGNHFTPRWLEQLAKFSSVCATCAWKNLNTFLGESEPPADKVAAPVSEEWTVYDVGGIGVRDIQTLRGRIIDVPSDKAEYIVEHANASLSSLRRENERLTRACEKEFESVQQLDEELSGLKRWLYEVGLTLDDLCPAIGVALAAGEADTRRLDWLMNRGHVSFFVSDTCDLERARKSIDAAMEPLGET
jgi:hypothetical protein